jgi:hypothetical protein
VGCGTVFKLSPPAKKGHAWGYTVLHRFNEAVVQGRSDGENPAAGLVPGKGGFYGTTQRGGLGSQAWGTIFWLKPPIRHGGTWTETIIYSFSEGGVGGYAPGGSVVLNNGGDLYGNAYFGGQFFGGTIFHLKPPMKTGKPWRYRVLYNFMPPPDGFEPVGSLIFDNTGNLYGTTQLGGTGPCQQGACGTVFEFTP